MVSTEFRKLVSVAPIHSASSLPINSVLVAYQVDSVPVRINKQGTTANVTGTH